MMLLRIGVPRSRTKDQADSGRLGVLRVETYEDVSQNPCGLVIAHPNNGIVVCHLVFSFELVGQINSPLLRQPVAVTLRNFYEAAFLRRKAGISRPLLSSSLSASQAGRVAML